MPRKENKLRPYRVDYFDVNEMSATDQALVRSVVVRAVTQDEAANLARVENGVWNEGRTVIRAYRFYKSVKPVTGYQDLDKLFTKQWVGTVRASLASMQKLFEQRRIDKQFEAMASDANYQKIAKQLTEMNTVPSLPFPDVCEDCGKPFGSLIFTKDGKRYHPICHDILFPVAAVCPYGYTRDNPGTAHTCEIHSAADYTPAPVVPCGTAEIMARVGLDDPSHFDLDAAAPIVNPAPEHGDVISEALGWNAPAPDTEIAAAVNASLGAPQMFDEHCNYTPEFVQYTLDTHEKDCGCQICHNNRPYVPPTGQGPDFVQSTKFQEKSLAEKLAIFCGIAVGVVVAVVLVLSFHPH